ncbi:hypothetical protein OQA88_4675 [Cercophora sp. LCS_1]
MASISAVSAPASIPLPRILTSSFIECEVPASVQPTNTAGGGNSPNVVVHHTSYIWYGWAACSTRQWLATYTIFETCPGTCPIRVVEDPHWIPPNFVVTTVTCDVCATPTQVITCPNALGTAEAIVHGDGITATVVVTPTPAIEVARPVVCENPPCIGAPTLPAVCAHPPCAPAAVPIATLVPAASGSRVLVGNPAVTGPNSPLVTAGAPSLTLKTGLAIAAGLSMAAVNFLL